ncbi:MAG TPA: spore coat U domain-containing protein [Steroidobacteraceae bacterium]|nr:spore coat U domain-containing protein [Steroidobacteraceae bacterium]
MKPAARIALCFIGLALLRAPAALADNCVLNVGNISFGSISGASGGDATGNMVLDCNTDTNPSLRVCISIGAPPTGDVRNRRLPGPSAAQLSYNLYSDAARTQIWGSITGTEPALALDFPISGGKVHATIPIYARVAAGQGALPAGNYSFTYAASDIQVGVQSYTVTPSPCSSIPISATINQSQMNISANLILDCSVSATDINFGSTATLGAASNTTGTVTVSCSSGVSYTLTMNAGTSAGGTITNRLMIRGGGTETIRYSLYTNSGRTIVWGNGTTGSTVTGTGGGNSQSYTVYARMPAQAPTPPPGNYSDRITLTISY